MTKIEPMEQKAGPGSGAVAPVENGKPADQGANLPAKTAPVATMARFGGLRGGKKREDGLAPGSPEAVEADRKKDAERKRAERAAATAASGPAVLPAKLPALTQGQLPAPSIDTAAGAVAASAPLVPWTAEIVRPFTSELVPVVELVDVGTLTEKAKAAGFDTKTVKELEKDFHWPTVAKKNLDVGLPRLAAKWLNKIGISAEHAEEVAVGSAVLMIWHSRSSVSKRLDKLIEQRKQQDQQNQKTRDAKPAEPVKLAEFVKP